MLTEMRCAVASRAASCDRRHTTNRQVHGITTEHRYRRGHYADGERSAM
jgi:hypothetical protein